MTVYMCDSRAAAFCKKTEYVQVEAEVKRTECRGCSEYSECNFAKMSEYQSVKDVCNIFECQRPLRSVQGIHLTPPTNIKSRSARNHEKSQYECHEDFPSSCITFDSELLALSKIIQQEPHNRAHNKHRVQSDKSSLEESPYCHFVPSVVVCVSNYESGKHKEEIDSQISMVDDLISRSGRISLQQVEEYHHD